MEMYKNVALALLLMISPVMAGENSGNSDARIPPPKIYDHKFDGVVITIKDITRCNQTFGRTPDNKRIAGCSGHKDKLCVIYVDPQLSLKNQQLVIKHEIAHCNGWPSSHPR